MVGGGSPGDQRSKSGAIGKTSGPRPGLIIFDSGLAADLPADIPCNLAQRRCPIGNPSEKAFCLIAPSVLLNERAILETGVLARECALRSRRCCLVQTTRARVFFLAAIILLLIYSLVLRTVWLIMYPNICKPLSFQIAFTIHPKIVCLE